MNTTNSFVKEVEWLSKNMDSLFSGFENAKPLRIKEPAEAPILVVFSDLGTFLPPLPRKARPPPQNSAISLPKPLNPPQQITHKELSDADIEAAMLSFDMDSFERSLETKQSYSTTSRPSTASITTILPPNNRPYDTASRASLDVAESKEWIANIEEEKMRLGNELKTVYPAYFEGLIAGRNVDDLKARKEALESKLEELSKRSVNSVHLTASSNTSTQYPVSASNNYTSNHVSVYDNATFETTQRIDVYNASDFGGDFISVVPDNFDSCSDSTPLCHCRLPTVEKVSRTDANMNRSFFCCSKVKTAPDRCDFFQWVDGLDSSVVPRIASAGSNIIRDPKVESRRIFGHRNFRPGQLECIEAALQNKDVFCLMPTGGGKSLVYQLPAWCNAGVAVVFSPLLSLIIDQVDALKALGIRAAYLSSIQDDAEINQLYTDLRDVVTASENEASGKAIKLLYLTPEKFSKSMKLKSLLNHLYRNNMLSRFVLDEAHCVSDWGHDFRADYLALGQLRPSYPNVPIMALTATANKMVIQDSIRIIGMKNPHLHTQSFNRSNISYVLHQKTSSVITDIANIIKSRPTQSGIIYCLSRKDTEKVVADLINAIPTMKRSIDFYHAEVKPELKERRQRLWSKGDIKVMVATIAFGMGINKPDVRYVIHYSLPKSLTNFYQESGRAGRDGFPSESILYFSYNDKQRLQSLLLKGGRGDEEIGGSGSKSRGLQNALTNLQQCMEYCLNEVDCRRTLLLKYFGESFPPQQCNNTCDNCRNRGLFQWADFSQAAVMVMNIVKALIAKRHNRVTVAMLRQLITGSKAKTLEKYRQAISGMKVLEPSGKEISKHNAEKLLYTMICKEYLDEESIVTMGSYTAEYVILGKRSEAIRHETIQISVKASVASTTTVSPDEIENGSNNSISRELDDGEEDDSLNVPPPLGGTVTSKKKKFVIPAAAGASSTVNTDVKPASKRQAKRCKKSPSKMPTPLKSSKNINDLVVSISDDEDDDDFMTKPSANRLSFNSNSDRSSATAPSNNNVSGKLTLKQKSAFRQWLNEYRKRWEIYWNYLNNSTVAEMVEKVPVTIAELGNIGGIGEVKIAQHGKHILATIWSFLQKHQLLDLFPYAEEPEVPECPTWRDPMSHAAEEIRKLDTARQREVQLGHTVANHVSPVKNYSSQQGSFHSPLAENKGFVSHSLHHHIPDDSVIKSNHSSVYNMTTPNNGNGNPLKRTVSDAELEEALDFYAYLVP